MNRDEGARELLEAVVRCVREGTPLTKLTLLVVAIEEHLRATGTADTGAARAAEEERRCTGAA